MTIEEHSKARLHGAKWALGLDVKATVEEVEAARARTHTSITLRADRMSGAPCVGDSRLTVDTIAHMDRETCRRDFPWVTDEQYAAVKAWIESPYGREWCKADAHYTAMLEAQRDRDGAIQERDEAEATCNENARRFLAMREERDELRDLLAKSNAAQHDLRRVNEIERAAAQREISHLRNEHQTIFSDLREEIDEARRELAAVQGAKVRSDDRLRTQIRELTKERDEARRLHADAVEELARVKMPTITAEQIELFIWREGWAGVIDDAPDMGTVIPLLAKALAQHLRGTK